MGIDVRRVRAAIEAAVQAEVELPQDVAADIAFHMTDWYDQLEEVHEFFQHPERLSAAEVSKLLFGFLIHVPNHVAAAKKLLTDEGVSDVFGVGAVESDTPADQG